MYVNKNINNLQKPRIFKSVGIWPREGAAN